MEDSLIEKTFYQSMLQSGHRHPMKDLGELFFTEQTKEIPDASYIRFSQGEVYYHHKDYEAAIYKWENVHNELEPWAKKNIADAYTKLELFSTAEEIYKSIVTDSKILKIEIFFGLFDLYLQQERVEDADQMIKQMLSLDPDYSNVTDLARNFYEEHEKWLDAVNLAIQEAIRTESVNWFDLLDHYVQKGYTLKIDLDLKMLTYALSLLYRIDFSKFEQLLSNLWKSYEGTPRFLQWVQEMTTFLLTFDWKTDRNWQHLPNILQETYEQLTSGTYAFSSVSDIMPNFLRLWINIVPIEKAVVPSAYIFAWHEKIRGDIPKELLERAEKTIFEISPKVDIFDHVIRLFKDVEKWAENNQLEIHQMYKQLLKELVDDRQLIGVISASGSEKMHFIHSFLNESIFYEQPNSIVSLFKYDDSLSIEEISEKEVCHISDFEQYQVMISKKRPIENSLVRILFPNRLLQDYPLTLMEFPEYPDFQRISKPMTDYLYAIDSLVYFCNEVPLKESDYFLLKGIQQKFPDLPICCVIKEPNGKNNQKNFSTNEMNQFAKHGIRASVFYYSASKKGRRELAQSLTKLVDEKKIKHIRPIKFVFFLQKLMDHLLTQREKMENKRLEYIDQQEDLASRIQGVIHQLKDLEEETITVIRHSYQNVKDDVKKEIMGKLPKLLKEKGDRITENHKFHHIVQQINEEMNATIETFIFEEIRPLFFNKIQDWLTLVEDELKKGKTFLDEVNDGFYSMIGERKFQLQWDFQIINDWQRDVNRLAGRIQLEEEPILSPYTPYQLLLISTGKILDWLKKDKAFIANRFKQYVRRRDYERVAQTVAETFFSSFMILEKGFEQDIPSFFQPSFDQLERFERELKEEIAEKRRELEMIKNRSTSFSDPLQFFEIRRMQWEFLLRAQQSYVPVSG
ncbi:tetratricopeptide repeat protein [Fervidibacillus halotolerans]|uniref:GTP-binding protein n=1 Tax=Fervidibacillus halotolerans TaxID=2980027 RepID=A0A9E8RYD7_9BACI|nr:hypothetical protein [Fervidibacillus halotolerans]WAA12736.1 hypothetical protein OE105_00900 [Fervidibacillus halotolerans]